MKIDHAYLQFINLVNRNLTNNNVNVDKARFVLLYNDISKRYVEWILEKRNEDVIRYIAPLLTLNKKLAKVGETISHDSYKLPTDFFDLSNVQVYASKGSCINQRLHTFEVKGEDIEELLADENNKPSFGFRETFYLLSGGSISVYKSDFDISKVTTSYYRYPREVDIEGYYKEDGKASKNIDPDLDDKVVGRILLAMSKEFSAINGDAQKYQLDKDRLFTEV